MSRTTSFDGLSWLVASPLASPSSRQCIIFTIIYFEFGAYVVIRQIVNAFEWLVAWRGHKQSLRQEMRKAKTYDEWIQAAKKMDKYLGFDEWKNVEEDSYFDYMLVRAESLHATSQLISRSDASGARWSS